MIVCLLLITLAGSFTRCTAHKNGAPLKACSTLLPDHGWLPQEGNAPYSISTHSLGNKISVIISSPTMESFKGFMLQARSASNKDNFIPGEFTTSDISKGVNCRGLEQSTLTHVDDVPKTQVLTEWNGTSAEDIIFRATVVKEYKTFWINIDSDPVAVEKRETEESHSEIAVPETHDCSESVYCLGLPEMCVENGNCKVLLKIKPNPSGTADFSLSGALEESEYMAMGISEDNVMGEDFVTECLRVGPTEVRLRKSWNKGKTNEDTTDISESGKLFLINGQTTCSWVEQKVLDFKGKTYDLTSKPYILLANGNVTKGDQTLVYHFEKKLSSSGPIDIFHSGSVDVNEDGDKKQMTEEQTTELTSESIYMDEAEADISKSNSCFQLNLNLFWLSLFAVFFARGRNLI